MVGYFVVSRLSSADLVKHWIVLAEIGENSVELVFIFNCVVDIRARTLVKSDVEVGSITFVF